LLTGTGTGTYQYCEEHGMDGGVNDRKNNGDTALRIAMMAEYLPAVVLLQEKSADVLASGDGDMPVLMKALEVSTCISSRLDGRSDAEKDAHANACLMRCDRQFEEKQGG
jgi:ankyrin repeat protein